MKRNIDTSKYRRNGFTLVELVVAIFIFSILVSVAGGSLVGALAMQRRSLNAKKIEENAKFILESMAREIRVANSITTGDSGCPGPTSLSFIHPVNGSITYFLSGSVVVRQVNGVDSTISSQDVVVSRLNFCVSGNSSGDDKQPRVTVILGLNNIGTSQTGTVDLQTTISQRNLSD